MAGGLEWNFLPVERQKIVKTGSNTLAFYKAKNFWIRKKDLKKINILDKDHFSEIKKFINVKYKWGGKHFSGVDCSGLIQLFLNSYFK